MQTKPACSGNGTRCTAGGLVYLICEHNLEAEPTPRAPQESAVGVLPTLSPARDLPLLPPALPAATADHALQRYREGGLVTIGEEVQAVSEHPFQSPSPSALTSLDPPRHPQSWSRVPRPAVTNRSDLRDHQWATDHCLATAGLDHPTLCTH